MRKSTQYNISIMVQLFLIASIGNGLSSIEDGFWLGIAIISIIYLSITVLAEMIQLSFIETEEWEEEMKKKQDKEIEEANAKYEEIRKQVMDLNKTMDESNEKHGTNY
jgi:hypothetical protein